MSSVRSSSSSSSSSLFRSAMQSLAARAKDHHEGIQAAYEAYYGAGMRTPRVSSDSDLSDSATLVSSSSISGEHKKSTWSKIKKMAKEHHESINTAYAVYYGGGRPLRNASAYTATKQV